MNSLHEIFCAWGTDKGAFHDYGPNYEEFLVPGSVRRLLEIGVWTGCSLLAWHEWLPSKARIWGVDPLPQPEAIHGVPRIHYRQGSIMDPALIATLPKEFDVIIDDGSHLSWEILGALDLLWPRLTPGGWYVVEDTYAPLSAPIEAIVNRVSPVEHHLRVPHNESEILFLKKGPPDP